MSERGRRRAAVRRGMVTACTSVWLCACVAANSGCAGDGPAAGTTALPTPTPTPLPSNTYAQIQHTVFDVYCLSAGCHNAASQAAGLVLEAAVSYEDLVNAAPTDAAAGAQGLLRVTPGSPEESYLYVKLVGPGADLGSRMPLGQPPLPEADIELVRRWIVAGAPPAAGR